MTPMEGLRLTFVNVGYGEAMVLECPDPSFPGSTFVMVIDGGSGEAGEYQTSDTGRIPLGAYLARHGVDHIDAMAVTHIHEDHLCGLLPVVEHLTPRAFWQTLPGDFWKHMRPLTIPTAGQAISRRKFLQALNDYQIICRRLKTEECCKRTLAAGVVLNPCKDLTIRVLGPSTIRAKHLEKLCRELYQETEEIAFWRRLDQLVDVMNNCSLILRIEYRGVRLLLPGDTNYMGYGDLTGEDLRADLFKVGHHGQQDGISRNQIQQIAPKAVVCCGSSDRRYNSAEPGILQMMADSGATLYFSDCPPKPDGTTPPSHQALVFTVDVDGTLHGSYLP